MPTVAELTFAEELVALREIAIGRGWSLRELDSLHFHLGLPASDDSLFYLLVDCGRLSSPAPAWDWCDADGKHTTVWPTGREARAFCTPTASSVRHGIGWRTNRLIAGVRTRIGQSAIGRTTRRSAAAPLLPIWRYGFSLNSPVLATNESDWGEE